MEIIKDIKLVQVCVLFTFIICVLFYKSTTIYRLLFLILLNSLLTELLSSILLFYDYNLRLLYSISFTIHNCLWLILLKLNSQKPITISRIISFYILFSLCNLIFIEGRETFNHYTFIVGAFAYIMIFTTENLHQLKKENFYFFQSNNYILFLAPVLFFITLSFLFSFKSVPLVETQVFDNVELFDIASNFVNIIYYALVGLYIYYENRLKNA